MTTVSFEAFNALSLERDRWKRQASYLAVEVLRLEERVGELENELEEAREKVEVLS